MVLLIGKPMIGFALGSAFHGQDSSRILITLMCLVVWILASAAGIFAVVELLARSELRRLAGLAGVMVVAVAGSAAVVSTFAGIEGIAAALSLVTAGATLVQIRWAFGAQWRNGVIGMLGAAGREAVILAAAFAPSSFVLLAFGDSLPTYLSAAVLAAVLVTVFSRIGWPREWQALLGVARRSSPRTTRQQEGSAAAPASESERAGILRA